MQSREIVPTERTLHRGLDAQEHAERGVRAGVAADIAGAIRQTGDVVRRTRNLDHVRDIHSDVFGRHVTTAEPLHHLAEGVQQVRRFGAICVGEDHRLAAAER